MSYCVLLFLESVLECPRRHEELRPRAGKLASLDARPGHVHRLATVDATSGTAWRGPVRSATARAAADKFRRL